MATAAAPTPTTTTSATEATSAVASSTPPATDGSRTTSSTPIAAATAARCPGGDVCDAALGIALTLPTGWQEASPGKFPPGDLALQIPAAVGQGDNDLRLQISPWGTTTAAGAAWAASAGMDRLLQGVNPPPARTAVHYGGATGLLVSEPQIPPNGVTAIILAHAGTVLEILAQGKALAPDQRQALASLRFIPRAGSFPLSN